MQPPSGAACVGLGVFRRIDSGESRGESRTVFVGEIHIYIGAIFNFSNSAPRGNISCVSRAETSGAQLVSFCGWGGGGSTRSHLNPSLGVWALQRKKHPVCDSNVLLERERERERERE